MLISYRRGQTSVILRVKILNSSVATGAGLTGLAYNSSGLIISTIADNEPSATAYTAAGSTIETITTLGTYAAPTATKCRFKEVDATNHKGVYEIQLADARFAVSSAKFLIVSISGATNAAETDVVIPLQDLDPYDAVRANLSALPNANAAASGGLLTAGTGTNQLNPSGGAIPVTGNVNVGSVNSGVVAADVWNATRASYATSGTFGQGAASVQGNVTGSVASVSGNVSGNVTGSVGSVAGNVGGNVAGSVGSISGVIVPAQLLRARHRRDDRPGRDRLQQRQAGDGRHDAVEHHDPDRHDRHNGEHQPVAGDPDLQHRTDGRRLAQRGAGAGVRQMGAVRDHPHPVRSGQHDARPDVHAR